MFNSRKSLGLVWTLLYGQKQQMQDKEPSKDKGFRKIFKEFGYQIYLLYEYRQGPGIQHHSKNGE
jgi:hypothetical protein